MPGRATILTPGVYDLTDADYHADPIPDGSLSCSGAKMLLPPNTPAHYDWARRNPRPEKRTFDFGHAAHAKILGIGAPVVVVDARDWRTKKAQEQRDEAYTNGHTPILTVEAEQVDAMATQILAHPTARQLFDPDHGKPEQSLFWQDSTFGVWRRARLDWLPERVRGRRLVVPDYKTAVSADSGKFEKACGDLRYDMQDDWYRTAVREVGLDESPEFVFVVQEKAAPFLVNVVKLSEVDRVAAARRSERALRVFAECTSSGVWPGYPHDSIPTLSLPPWANRDLEYAA